jgi:hypothetical protein
VARSLKRFSVFFSRYIRICIQSLEKVLINMLVLQGMHSRNTDLEKVDTRISSQRQIALKIAILSGA